MKTNTNSKNGWEYQKMNFKYCKTMDVYQWVETIPFRETRDYVQGVLAYNVVYDRLRNGSQSLFRDVELAMRY